MYYFLEQVTTYIKTSLLSSKAYLLPLRFFLALGWLRASAEKMVSPDWTAGESLEMFLYNAQNETPFGFYKLFIETLFLPNVEFLSFAVAALQMAIGLALALGAVSQLALLLGLFLNLNFILAGVVNPSVFYIMIELVLLSGHAGAVIGVDAYLSKFISQPWLIAQTQASQNRTTLKFQFWRNTFLIGLILTISIVDFSYIKAFSPEASVEDPAMLLYILAMFTIMQLVICNLQIQHRLQRLPVQPGTIFRFEGVS